MGDGNRGGEDGFVLLHRDRGGAQRPLRPGGRLVLASQVVAERGIGLDSGDGAG